MPFAGNRALQVQSHEIALAVADQSPSIAAYNHGVTAFQFVAVLAGTLFSGAAIYINLVEHPARMECGTELAASVFRPSYRRAAVMQAILALAATIAGIAAWLMYARLAWLVGALLIFAVVPFTLIAIRPTNNQLLDPALDRTSKAAHTLLQRWGKLHAVRSILALAASVIFLSLVLSSPPKH